MIDALEKEIEKDPEIKAFLKKLSEGKADQQDVSLFGANLGECVGKIINRNIDKDMSWDELNNMAMPLFEEVYGKMFDAASIVQIQEDKKQKIGIKPIRPEFPKQKIHDLIYKIYTVLKEQEDGD